MPIHLCLKNLRPEHQTPIAAGIERTVGKHQIPSESVMLIGGYAPVQGRIAIGFSVNGGESIDLNFDTSRLDDSIVEECQKLDAALGSRQAQ